MTSNAGPQSPVEVAATIAEVAAEGKAAADPEWYAKYGENLSSSTDYIFGVCPINPKLLEIRDDFAVTVGPPRIRPGQISFTLRRNLRAGILGFNDYVVSTSCATLI